MFFYLSHFSGFFYLLSFLFVFLFTASIYLCFSIWFFFNYFYLLCFSICRISSICCFRLGRGRNEAAGPDSRSVGANYGSIDVNELLPSRKIAKRGLFEKAEEVKKCALPRARQFFLERASV